MQRTCDALIGRFSPNVRRCNKLAKVRSVRKIGTVDHVTCLHYCNWHKDRALKAEGIVRVIGVEPII